MTRGNYQRRYLRAPYREELIYSDGESVLKAPTINISEDGMLIDFLPSFPVKESVQILFPLRTLPMMKNLSLHRLRTFSHEMVETKIIRATAQVVRKDQLSQDLENIFKSRFGLHFLEIGPEDQQLIEKYVTTFSANLVYLQTLIDSYNADDETKLRVRALAKILGYKEKEKIAKLRLEVTNDYKNLQWL